MGSSVHTPDALGRREPTPSDTWLPTFRDRVKLALAGAADATGALGLLRHGRRPRVHIFGYHRVVPNVQLVARTAMPQLCVSTESFVAHLDHLTRCYEVWPLDRAVQLIAGALPAPRRDVAVITFDDGYRDVLTEAAPLLRARRLPATVFMTSDVGDGRPMPHDRLYALVRRAADRNERLLLADVPDRLIWPLARAEQALAAGAPLAAADALLEALSSADLEIVASALAARIGEPGDLPALLNWSELGRLLELGFTVGAHGASHVHLPLETDARLVEELTRPRALFERHLGITPTLLSYPAGRYDVRVIAAARAAGYVAGLTTEERKNRIGSDPFRLGRKVLTDAHGLGPNGVVAPALVAAQLDGLFSTLGLSRAVPGDKGLESPWL